MAIDITPQTHQISVDAIVDNVVRSNCHVLHILFLCTM